MKLKKSNRGIKKRSRLHFIYRRNTYYGWREPLNFASVFNNEQSLLLDNLDINFLTPDYYFSEIDLNQDSIINRVIDIFDLFPYYKTHTKAMVIKLEEDEAYLINENFELKTISWTSEYKWARQAVSINELGQIPRNFFDLSIRSYFSWFSSILFLDKRNFNYWSKLSRNIFTFNANNGSNNGNVNF